MIKVSVMYPRNEATRFDMDYYRSSHMPMVSEKLGTALKNMTIDEGLSGAAPGSPPAFAAMGHLYFDTVESFQAAFGPHAEAIMGDIPNYTNSEPVVQISEVKLG